MKSVFLLTIIFMLSLAGPVSGLQEMSGPFLTLRYEDGLDGAAKNVFSLVPALKKDLEKKTGLPFDFSFTIFLVKDRSDFVRMVGSGLVSAVAVPERKLVVIDLSRMSVHPLNIERITLHEMCHLLLHGHVRHGLLPRWFDEGVSQWVSGGNELIDPDPRRVLKRAVISNKLLSFHEISISFPQDEEGFALGYEQSLNMVEYIAERFGKGAMRSILGQMSGGMTFNDAFSNVTGISFNDAVSDWYRKVKMRFTWFTYISDNLLWILFVLAGVLTVYGYFMFRKRLMDYKDEDDDLAPPL